MSDIVLATLNAKYIHAAFGLRYLLANLGELRPRASLAEFDINQRPLDIVEALLAHQPRIIGLGVYIWNAAPATEVVAALKRLRPDITVILGGPEVSYETEQQEITRLADHVITGEADLKFAEVCRALLASSVGDDVRSLHSSSPEKMETPHVVSYPKIIPAEPPDLAKLALPYEFYSDDDVAHRVVYVEASRGCPFTCEFCLSSLDIPVRQFPLEPLLAALDKLLARGLRQFKFVDRTFNLNLAVSRAILEFFLARLRPGLFVHFEMIPDRLPPALREVIAKFPPGALQFEVGVQTFDDATSHNISRRQDLAKLEDNFRFLREHTGVHIHADLIVGLPGESMEGFAAGFDRLVALGPQEIQVGILKRLRGTPIVRHDAEWEMIYSPQPPYEILRNRLMDFATMQRLRRFARYWDLVANSGNFVETTPLIWSLDSACVRAAENEAALLQAVPRSASPFWSFLRFSDWLYAQVGRRHGIALATLAEKILEFLTGELALDPRLVAETLWRDYQRGGRKDRPGFLEPHLPTEKKTTTVHISPQSGPKRQARRQTVPG